MQFIASDGTACRHACVVDAAGTYQTLVLAKEVDDKDQIQSYALKDGERTIDAPPPVLKPHTGATGFIRPTWDGAAWVEGMTAAQVTQWERAHPAPKPAPPSPAERIRADLDFIAAMTGVQL